VRRTLWGGLCGADFVERTLWGELHGLSAWGRKCYEGFFQDGHHGQSDQGGEHDFAGLKRLPGGDVAIRIGVMAVFVSTRRFLVPCVS